MASVSHSHPAYAGLGRRLAAYIIDILICVAILAALVPVLRWLSVFDVRNSPEHVTAEELWRTTRAAGKLLATVSYILAFGPIYLGFFEASPWQASIGKRLISVYVTDTAGRRLSLGRSLGRSFTKCVLNSSYIGAISILMISLTQEKEALHDQVVKTRVVRGRLGGSPEVWRIVSAFGIQYLWLLAGYTAAARMVRFID